MSFDNKPSPLEGALMGGPVKTAEPETSTNPIVGKVRDYVRTLRQTQDESAKEVLHMLDEALVQEDNIGGMHGILDQTARNVETCDAITQKLDEVEKELP